MYGVPFDAEYAAVYGVPLAFIPSDRPPTDPQTASPAAGGVDQDADAEDLGDRVERPPDRVRFVRRLLLRDGAHLQVLGGSGGRGRRAEAGSGPGPRSGRCWDLRRDQTPRAALQRGDRCAHRYRRSPATALWIRRLLLAGGCRDRGLDEDRPADPATTHTSLVVEPHPIARQYLNAMVGTFSTHSAADAQSAVVSPS